MKYRVTIEIETRLVKQSNGWWWELEKMPNILPYGMQPTKKKAQAALDAKLKEMGAEPLPETPTEVK